MSKRIIIAGGGTGGHIFPAIAIANALKKRDEKIEILFVGAKGKMEMEKVPQAGYEIIGIDITGFNRSSLIKNAGLPFRLVKSFFQVRSILKKFQPDAVVGVGGYSSFPVLRMAQARGIPTYIHESNSFAGKSNILLGKRAKKIFVASDGMEKFFPAEKMVLTGNPVRAAITQSMITRSEGIRFFELDELKMTVLVIGGSLGARSINEAVDKQLEEILQHGLQLIWQTGKPYAERAKERARGKNGVWTHEFISKMEFAYAAADIVVARAGAMTVAELCVAKKPVVFVPYPFAAENHQAVNAMKLVNRNAALIVNDSEAGEKLVPLVIELSGNENRRDELKKNISALAMVNADMRIAEEILKDIK
jgi:UDP-N-acetylglucosamine--N-acetylmuramyl-(pentapeptide) pyrophosphoryl-undecaprenol N-acetylglucosamine transferase